KINDSRVGFALAELLAPKLAFTVLDVLKASEQLLVEGTEVEVWGTVQASVDARQRERLPRELPLGSEMRAGPEGLLIFPVHATKGQPRLPPPPEGFDRKPS